MWLFQVLAPAVDWLDFLSSSLAPLELNDSEPVVVYAREYLQQVSELINKTDRRSELQPELLKPPGSNLYVCLTDLPVSLSISSLLNNYMMWTLVQKNVASLDQRFENAQDKLLESLYGTKKVLHTSHCDVSKISKKYNCNLRVFLLNVAKP